VLRRKIDNSGTIYRYLDGFPLQETDGEIIFGIKIELSICRS